MRFELTTSALPRRRSVHWSYRGEVPGADSNLRAPISRTGRDASNPRWSGDVSRCRPGSLPYRGRVTAVCDGEAPVQAMAVPSASPSTGSLCLRRCWISRCDSNALPSASLLVPPAVGLRGNGAATRCRPGPSAVRRRSRSRARRRELPSEDSNLDSLIQGQEACH